MSNLSTVNTLLLTSIKQKIEQLAGMDSNREWVQKDYEFLRFFIEEETGSRLGLSTIKRIWRNEFNRMPHISTLDILSKLAYGQDWLSLKKDWLENRQEEAQAEALIPTKEKHILPISIAIFSVVAILALVSLISSMQKGDSIVEFDESKITFSAKQSIEGEIPNTVVFSYDVQSVEADSFFLQQSWDRSRRVKIEKDKKERTDIYYIPGYFTAQLLANTTVVKTFPIHVTSKDWFVAVRQPISTTKAFAKASWLDTTYLGIQQEAFDNVKIDWTQAFDLGYYNVRDFGVDGDNFSYSLKAKMEQVDAIACPTMSLLIKGEQNYCWIMFSQKGCESELQLAVSETVYPGKTHDLTNFGTDIYDWQTIDIQIEHKKYQFFLNDQLIFENAYQNPIGNIKEITLFFKGIGMIDDVELKDEWDKVRFFDDFN